MYNLPTLAPIAKVPREPFDTIAARQTAMQHRRNAVRAAYGILCQCDGDGWYETRFCGVEGAHACDCKRVTQ